MQSLLKRLTLILVGLVGLVVVSVTLLYVATWYRLNRTYHIPVETIEIPTDASSIERGRVLAEAKCAACHGDDMSGKLLWDDPSLWHIAAPNLTTGEGGVGRVYSDADFVRAIRHGVGVDGRPLLLMPSDKLFYLSDTDVGAILAYLRSLPPRDITQPAPILSPRARLLVSFGPIGSLLRSRLHKELAVTEFPVTLTSSGRWLVPIAGVGPRLLPAELIDHRAVRPPAPMRGATAEYGRYLWDLTDSCEGCHRLYTAEDDNFFITAVKSGEFRASELERDLAQATTDEEKAFFLYLLSLVQR